MRQCRERWLLIGPLLRTPQKHFLSNDNLSTDYPDSHRYFLLTQTILCFFVLFCGLLNLKTFKYKKPLNNTEELMSTLNLVGPPALRAVSPIYSSVGQSPTKRNFRTTLQGRRSDRNNFILINAVELRFLNLIQLLLPASHLCSRD